MKTRPVQLILFLLLLCLNTSAQEKRMMTFEDVLSLSSVSDAQISPDGRWVAYVVTKSDLKQNASDSDVWLVSASGGTPVKLTTSPKNDNQPRWSPDGKRLAFVSAREEKPQIFLISPFGGESQQLTTSKTGVQSFDWAPEGNRIAYVAQREPTPEEEQKQKDKDDAQVIDRAYKYSRIWVVDIRTRKAVELVKGDFSATDPQWSPSGEWLAYVVTPTPKADDGSLSDIWVTDVAAGTSHKLYENAGPDSSPRWSPEGRFIAFLSRDKPAELGQSWLTVISSETGSPDGAYPRRLARNLVYQPGAPIWSHDGSTIYFTASVKTTSQLFAASLFGGEWKQLTDFAGMTGSPTFSSDGSSIAFTRASVTQPPDVYTAKVSSIGTPQKRTDHNPQIRDLSLATSEVIRWPGSDGKEIEGILVYPVNYERGKRYPMVALIHGGPAGVWTQNFAASWSNFGQVWAGKGWAVFYPNVRGSSGYGEDFLLSNVKDWGGGDYRDIQTGIDHLIAKGIADPDRLAQSGWSYGGYMTAWTLVRTTRFKAAMVGAGLTNMYSMYSTNDLQRILDGYFGGQPWDNAEFYWSKSAMAFIRKAKTPTLILHGAADARVPPSQAQELYMGLKHNGVPVELVLFPREPHGLQEPRHQLDKMRREYAWFSKHVLGIEEPAPRTEKVNTERRPEEKPSGLR